MGDMEIGGEVEGPAEEEVGDEGRRGVGLGFGPEEDGGAEGGEGAD